MHRQSIISLLVGLVYVSFAATVQARATSAAPCKQYVIQDSDSCLKISKNNKITYAQIVSWNSEVDSLCSKVGSLKGTKICVSNPLGDFSFPSNTQSDTSTATTPAAVPSKVPDDTTRNCGKYALVEQGQDCSDLLAASSITMKDFMVLNPQVWENCTNLWVDYYYCVKPVGTVTTYPGYGGTPVTSTTEGRFTQVQGRENRNATNPLDRYKSLRGIVPLAEGTRLDCATYYWIENITDNDSANCWALAGIYGIEPAELVLWNPSLAKANKTIDELVVTDASTASATDIMTYTNHFAYPCTVCASKSYCLGLSSATTSQLQSSTRLCRVIPLTNLMKRAGAVEEIEAPTPRAAGEIANCTSWFLMKADRRCDDLMLTYSLEFAEFYKMNPSVGEKCTGLVAGTYYCRSTVPGGKLSGIPGWSSSTDDDTPPPTATTSSLPGTTTTWRSVTSGTKTTATKGATPSPVQSGMTDSCTKFHKVVKGDTCYDIAEDAKIKLETFYSWNPAVKDDCSALELDTYVCVSTS
ncbi:hypothetical protein CDV31_002832 [Fusarium ambrosium]|uniref:LysM domain-containing protein n=1 Tax=Fusarium ambrosium TaxID=131363 RepID=A0A428UVJ5_9HYPO|nr:hypothetical protein CDV31_002832 [Fusarium ambrosium]